MTKIAMASDHAGFDLKQIIKPYLEEKGYEVLDFRPSHPTLATTQTLLTRLHVQLKTATAISEWQCAAFRQWNTDHPKQASENTRRPLLVA